VATSAAQAVKDVPAHRAKETVFFNWNTSFHPANTLAA